MAEVHGFLREDKATYGEKQVLKKLRQNLPKEYYVYVECPINDQRQQRFPDFIVLTNYAVIVLEVKDWVQINRLDKYSAEILTRQNQVLKQSNPVLQSREIAIALNNELRRLEDAHPSIKKNAVPWGYGVVLPNLPYSVISQIRSAWGEDWVLSLDDLDPALVNTRLKRTVPDYKTRSLSKDEIEFIRATINPSVLIEQPGKPTIILDEEQEKIVSENVQRAVEPRKSAVPGTTQLGFLPNEESDMGESAVPETEEIDLPDYEQKIVENTSVRLVRGIAGSGKSLVLTQRAKYLAAKYPEWDILLLTYNKELAKGLQSTTKGIPRLEAINLDKLCARLMRGHRQWNPTRSTGWIQSRKSQSLITKQLGADFVSREFSWLYDMGIDNLNTYLDFNRKGMGKALGAQQRSQIFDFFEKYRAFLSQEDQFDWAESPGILLEASAAGRIELPAYDAILIDEAQDFSPMAIRLVKKLVKENGLLFLADDPTQSIYKLFSWREKGVHVVGRTRRLRIPYRNTYEIYKAAFQVIQDDDVLHQQIRDEGNVIAADLDSIHMRHGDRPLLSKHENFNAEILYIRTRIEGLLQEGVDPQQIAVLHRRSNGARRLEKELRGLDVHAKTFHAFKGLEFEIVFLTQLQETFPAEMGPDQVAEEKRLLYMAMTRARNKLFMGYSGKLPKEMKGVVELSDHVL